MSCPLNFCSQILLAVTSSVVSGSQYYKLYCEKLCCLIRKKTFFIKVSSTAAGTEPAAVVTKCGGILNLYAQSTGVAVPASTLVANTVYQINIQCDNGVPKGMVQGL